MNPVFDDPLTFALTPSLAQTDQLFSEILQLDIYFKDLNRH